jgi:peptidoglycan hydrolase-like protein with peptidoglycan-binding domain
MEDFMRPTAIRSLFLALLPLAPGLALAQDVALILGNNDYANARDIGGALDLLETSEAFNSAGFTVYAVGDADAAALREIATEFAATADGSGRIVIALAGHFAQSRSGAWFLGADADEPGLFGAGAQGLALPVLYEIAARAPGRAIVLLGNEDRRIDLGPGLEPGFGAIPVPQGVAVVKGDASEIAEFAVETLLVPGQDLAAGLEDYSYITGEGFFSAAFPFQPVIAEGSEEEPAPRPAPDAGERTAWAAALAEDTGEAYARYLRDYPDGVSAPLARAALERIRAAEEAETPRELTAEDIENAIRLSRDERRAIQRNLTALGYDTRGVDGVFGRGSRGAIADWQRDNRFEATGYVTREQIARIADQARRTSAETDAERAERERQDNAYWEATGADGTEEGLEAYLRRYPEGVYADRARRELAELGGGTESSDRNDWNEAATADTLEAYQRYLRLQPEGDFRDEAQARIAELSEAADTDAALRTEESLGLNLITRNLVESRLESLGLRPGRVDGVFDSTTRRAIARYQEARELPATGYLSQATIVRLLADSIRIE